MNEGDSQGLWYNVWHDAQILLEGNADGQPWNYSWSVSVKGLYLVEKGGQYTACFYMWLVPESEFSWETLSCSSHHAALIVPSLRSTRPSLVQKPDLWSSWTSVRWFFRHPSMKSLRTPRGGCRTSMIPQQVLGALFSRHQFSLASPLCRDWHQISENCCCYLLTLSYGARKRS